MHCTFTVYFLSLSLSLVRMKIRDSDTLAWVREQRNMSQVLGAFELLDITMLRPVLAWRAFWNLGTVYLFNFPIFFSGCGKPRILYQWIRGHGSTSGYGGTALPVDTGARLYQWIRGHGCIYVATRCSLVTKTSQGQITSFFKVAIIFLHAMELVGCPSLTAKAPDRF
jgi:hypothetical protein